MQYKIGDIVEPTTASASLRECCHSPNLHCGRVVSASYSPHEAASLYVVRWSFTDSDTYSNMYVWGDQIQLSAMGLVKEMGDGV